MNVRPIILLDLNYTLVGNSDDPSNKIPYPGRIKRQTYRRWLIDLIAHDYRVFIITARPEKHRDTTLADLQEKESWQPERSYWNGNPPSDLRPPQCKEKHLLETLFPEFGRGMQVEDHDNMFGGVHDVSPFYAIESNASTRSMYKKYRIPSARCEWIKAGDSVIPLYEG